MATVTGGLAIDQPFRLDAVLDGTQDFRWRPYKGWYSGVLDGNVVHVRQVSDSKLKYRASSDLSNVLRSYFRLNVDIDATYQELSAVDDTMAELVSRHQNLRVLRQPDPWQATASYICSATSRIERISRSIENIASQHGKKRRLAGDVRHTFPTPKEVLSLGEAELQNSMVGLKSFPARIVGAAERVVTGKLDLAHLAERRVGYAEARLQLMAVPGIGAKVADCIALFALDKSEAFPVDRYVAASLKRWYPAAPSSSHEREALAMWARETFGQNAGYASQLLFLAAREREGKRVVLGQDP